MLRCTRDWLRRLARDRRLAKKLATSDRVYVGYLRLVSKSLATIDEKTITSTDRHPTRDIAAKRRYNVDKPGALLSKFLPSLEGPGKMSSSDEVPRILLSDNRETVVSKIHTHAYSGGPSSIEAHQEQGGNPEVAMSYQLLYYFFEESDERVEQLQTLLVGMRFCLPARGISLFE